MNHYRSLTAHLQPAGLRVEQFEGRPHLVAPVVLMKADITVRPVTSGVAELVPARALRQAPAAWNGRPVTLDHPVQGGANAPHTLEARSFGRVFNARFTGAELVAEVWLSVDQAERVGPDAVAVIDRLRKGQTVEISVGALVELERRSGTTAAGKNFQAVWVSVFPDHVAMLREGQIGACSITDGCGAGRRTSLVAARAKASTSVAEVREMLARQRYEDEVVRIRRAAAAAPPPDPYTLALERRRN